MNPMSFYFLGPRRDHFSLSPAEIQRYARHLIMPEVALAGQKRLKAAKVLCIGTGGLGRRCHFTWPRRASARLAWPTSMSSTSRICNARSSTSPAMSDGRRSTAPRRSSRRINPDLTIVRHEQTIDSSNALEIVRRLRRDRRWDG